jgi:16S rRNA (uracil1498-N3)-methyltransferase
MSRFFVPPEAVKGNSITISGKEAHHIIDVMRLKVSDRVVTFDGTGKEYAGIISGISRNLLTVEIAKTRLLSEKMSSKITLLQALTKKEKMDYIVEKATELGVYSMIPVITARTIPDWDKEKRQAQADRWRKIAREAAKQCGRADVPAVSEITNFMDAIKKSGSFNACFIAVLSDSTMPLKQAIAGSLPARIAIAIGPEGDFTADESNAAMENGFKAVNLGPRVLKSDTAGLALLSILDYESSN